MPLWRKRERVRPRYESDELSERMQTAVERLNDYAATMKMLVEQDPNGDTNDEPGPAADEPGPAPWW
jgi:hypothetical protein